MILLTGMVEKAVFERRLVVVVFLGVFYFFVVFGVGVCIGVAMNKTPLMMVLRDMWVMYVNVASRRLVRLWWTLDVQLGVEAAAGAQTSAFFRSKWVRWGLSLFESASGPLFRLAVDVRCSKSTMSQMRDGHRLMWCTSIKDVSESQ